MNVAVELCHHLPLILQEDGGFVVPMVSWGGGGLLLAPLKGRYLFICLSCLGFYVFLSSKFELFLLTVSTMRVSKPTFFSLYSKVEFFTG